MAWLLIGEWPGERGRNMYWFWRRRMRRENKVIFEVIQRLERYHGWTREERDHAS